MAFRVPTNYRKSTEPNITTYTFSELASGLGYSTLYLSDVEPADTYMLTTNTSYGKLGVKRIISTATLNADFSTTINQPIVIQGKSLVNLCTACLNNDSGSQTSTRLITCYVKQNSTTLISGQATLSYGTLAPSGQAFRNLTLPLTIPKTQLNTNDVLTLRVEVSADGGTSDADVVWEIGVDPAGRDPTTLQAIDPSLYNSSSKFFLPVNIDL